VTYQSLYATNDCGKTGSVFSDLTLSYETSQMSTMHYPSPEKGLDILQGLKPFPFNFADLKNCSSGDSCKTEIPSESCARCNPAIEFPIQLTTLDPAVWASCLVNDGQLIEGVYDPPRALVPVAALGPPTSTPQSELGKLTPSPDATPTAEPQITSSKIDPVEPSVTDSSKTTPASLSDPTHHLEPSPPRPTYNPGASQSPADPPSSEDPSLAKAPSRPMNLSPQSVALSQAKSKLATYILSAFDGAPSPLNTPPKLEPGSSLQRHPTFIMAGGFTFSVGHEEATVPTNPAVNSKLPHTAPFINAQTSDIFFEDNRSDSPAPTPSAPSHAVVATSTFSLPSAGASNITIGGSMVSINGPEATIFGTPVSLGSDGLVIGTSTYSLATEPATTAFVGQAIPELQNLPEIFAISGTTLRPGGQQVTISGKPIFVNPSGGLVVGTSTADHSLITTTPVLHSSDVGIVSHIVIELNSGRISVDGLTLTPSGQHMTVWGTPIFINPIGDLVVGTSTIHNPFMTTAPILPPSYFTTIGGKGIVLNSNDAVIDGVTLTSGGLVTTLSGNRVSIGSLGLLVGTSTIAFPATAMITAAGRVFTPLEGNMVDFDGKTLSLGGTALTETGLDGKSTVLSMGSYGIMAGASTVFLPTKGVTRANGQIVTASANDILGMGGTVLSMVKLVLEKQSISATSSNSSGLMSDSTTSPFILSSTTKTAKSTDTSADAFSFTSSTPSSNFGNNILKNSWEVSTGCHSRNFMLLWLWVFWMRVWLLTRAFLSCTSMFWFAHDL